MAFVVSPGIRARAHQLWELIDVDRLRDMTFGFLEIGSPTGDETAFANHLAQTLRQVPMAVEMTYQYPKSPNVIAVATFGCSGRTLQHDGHLDTIANPHDPPKFEKGLFFGLGACNIKGALTCMIEVARILIAPGAARAGQGVRYLWAQLLARSNVVFALKCSKCGGRVHLVGFIKSWRRCSKYWNM